MNAVTSRMLPARNLTRGDFAPFGEVIQREGSTSFPINNGRCQRHHALASVDLAEEGAPAIISIFAGQHYKLPHEVTMVERHPRGSQAFFPLGDRPWLVIVCDDDDGRPVNPKAFLAGPDQGVNLARNVWHGVLTPLHADSDFLVVDYGGKLANLEEHHFGPEETFRVVLR